MLAWWTPRARQAPIARPTPPLPEFEWDAPFAADALRHAGIAPGDLIGAGVHGLVLGDAHDVRVCYKVMLWRAAIANEVHVQAAVKESFRCVSLRSCCTVCIATPDGHRHAVEILVMRRFQSTVFNRCGPMRVGRPHPPMETVLRWLSQLLEALSHLHDCGIAHRDVKAGNCFLDAADQLFLGDYGSATANATSADRVKDLSMVRDMAQQLLGLFRQHCHWVDRHQLQDAVNKLDAMDMSHGAR